LKPNIELIETLRKSKKITLEQMGKLLGYKANHKQNAMYAMTTLSRLDDIAKILNVPEHSLTLEGKK
jgi:transcriptional regulator with XRE-family HTH domain